MPSPLVVKLGSKDFIPPLAVLVTSIKIKVQSTHPLRICMWLNGCPNRITAPAGTMFRMDFTDLTIILSKIVSKKTKEFLDSS